MCPTHHIHPFFTNKPPYNTTTNTTMPKATKVGRFRASARAVASAPLTSSPTNQNDSEDAQPSATDGKEVLSRGQRKRLHKREQYLKREKMVLSSLRLAALEEQKGKIDGLDAIREALIGTSGVSTSTKTSKTSAKSTAYAPSSNSCNTNKSKKTLANTDISHMGLVLEHPSFQQNPFVAIQQHLRNSLAPQAEKLQAESIQRIMNDDAAEAKKKEERKERQRDAKFDKTKKRRGGMPSNRSRR